MNNKKIITIYDEYNPNEYYPGITSLNPKEEFTKEVIIELTDQKSAIEKQFENIQDELERSKNQYNVLKEKVKQVDEDGSKKILLQNTVNSLLEAHNGLNLNFSDINSISAAKQVYEQAVEGIDLIIDKNIGKPFESFSGTEEDRYLTLEDFRKAKREGKVKLLIDYTITQPACVAQAITSTTGIGSDVLGGSPTGPVINRKDIWVKVTHNSVVYDLNSETDSTKTLMNTSGINVNGTNYATLTVHLITEINSFIQVNLPSVINSLVPFEVIGFSAKDGIFFNADELGGMIFSNLLAAPLNAFKDSLNKLFSLVLDFLKNILKIIIKIFALIIIVLSIIGIIKKIIAFIAQIGPLLKQAADMVQALLNQLVIPNILVDILKQIQGFVVSSIDNLFYGMRDQLLNLANSVPLYLIEEANSNPVSALQTATKLVVE